MKMHVAALIIFCLFVRVAAAQGLPAVSGQVAPQPYQVAPQPPPQTTPTAQPVMAPAPPATMFGQFAGGVPTGKATPGVLPLPLGEAIDRGLKFNLGLLLGEQTTRTARAARYQALTGLLPYVTTRTSEYAQQVNLRALGFQGAVFPGLNPIVGPFGVFDARVNATQQVLNFTAIYNTRASSEGVRAADYSFQDARDVVVLVVTNLYLQAVAGSARIDAARAQLNTAQALYDRAVNLKAAGVVASIEVVRAQVELQAQQQRLIFFQNEFEKEKLDLARAIGLPIGQQFSLSTQIPYTPPPVITFEQALDQAYKSRSDYKSAQALVAAAELARKSAVSERWPAISFTGNYGSIGPRITDSHGTFLASVGLDIPVFQGGRVRGDILQADALLQQRRAELEDLRASIDYDVRRAFLDLKAAGEQVQVAQSAAGLARLQLTQAQDRFTAGVTNNLEVVQAQAALATADENFISSLYAYNAAKAALARALGVADKAVREFLGAK